MALRIYHGLSGFGQSNGNTVWSCSSPDNELTVRASPLTHGNCDMVYVTPDLVRDVEKLWFSQRGDGAAPTIFPTCIDESGVLCIKLTADDHAVIRNAAPRMPPPSGGAIGAFASLGAAAVAAYLLLR